MSLRIELGWDRNATSGDSEHWLVATLRGFPRTDQPASFAILMDTSTSMLGRRLAYAREAVAGLVSACLPADRLVVYSFGSAVTEVLDTPGGADVGAVLAGVGASGKTRLDLALSACAKWMTDRSGPRYVVVLTDGDPTDVDGRLAAVDPILSQARSLGASGVRTSVIGIGSAASYDGSFLRSLADAGGGTSAVGVEPSGLPERILGVLRGDAAEEVELTLALDSDVLEVHEAWRVAPRVEPLTLAAGRVAVAVGEGGGIGFRVRYRAPLAAGRGVRSVGTLRVRQAEGTEVAVDLTLTVAAPRSAALRALNAEVDQFRVRVELARTAQLRSMADDPEDPLRHTRRLSGSRDA